MPSFDDLLSSAGTLVIGTHLWPSRFFHVGPVAGQFGLEMVKVIREVTLRDFDVLVTRSGGLFVEPPNSFPKMADNPEHVFTAKEIQDKKAFERTVALAFNDLVCELALVGIVGEPAGAVQIGRGKVVSEPQAPGESPMKYAMIVGAAGGREMYSERTMTPTSQAIQGDPSGLHFTTEEKLDEALTLRRVRILGGLSDSLPTLIAGALSMYSRGLTSEALVDGWIVVEQLLDHFGSSAFGVGRHASGILNPSARSESYPQA